MRATLYTTTSISKPTVRLHHSPPMTPFAIVALGVSGYLTPEIHLDSAESARAMADAFTRAAELLDGAEGGGS